jgi:hypothetical protein
MECFAVTRDGSVMVQAAGQLHGGRGHDVKRDASGLGPLGEREQRLLR